MKVVLKTPLSPTTGYGNDGIGMTEAFMELGWDVFLLPLHVSPPLPRDIAMLLTRDFEGPFDLIVNHAPPADLSLSASLASMARASVGWSMWEWEDLNADAAKDFGKRTSNYDLLLSYDPVSYRAIEKENINRIRHEVLQGGFSASEWPYAEHRPWGQDVPFRFAMTGALHERKDPFVTIRAFERFREVIGPDVNAELHLKTVTRTLHPGLEDRYEGVKVHYGVWDHATLYEFYASMHCMVSSSRGEGKNLPALESMATGIPSIATNYGGHEMWLSTQWAWPLEYTLKTTAAGTNARASEDHLVACMVEAYSDREATRKKGFVASQSIPVTHDWTSVVRRLLDKVNA